ncbi:PREDICTED: uncharacterized protein LOC106120722 [Papilio xuthus]|uniref:Uncharacterized protein LOC106120722 n=2 Tax=Papilio xuthus TaxID=66420 RepID=A0A194Q459_PAPXU|nr:PREDICTED: uncharacterized protein LOC106120722 [Papilio xuthus]KPI98195.1 hypothetical protein RR46_09411 [Papilio xuthus]
MDNILIEAVSRREPIWNPASGLHRNSNVLKCLWQEVANEVNKDVKSVKSRWKNLRSYYVKECQKLDSKTPEGEEQISSWQYFDDMQFLRQTLTSHKTNKQEEYDGDEIYITNLDAIANPEPLSPGQSSSETSHTTPTTRKRKLQALATTSDTLIELERKKLKILENDIARGSNDDLLFFESLLPYMKEIPIDRKLRLRSKIQDLICGELEVVQAMLSNDE